MDPSSPSRDGLPPTPAAEDPAGELLLVLTTMPDTGQAQQLARALVAERLIACANLVPGLTSVFRWEDEVQTAGEVLLLLKTRRSKLSHLSERVRALHPYDNPELLALPVEAGLEAYCHWVLDETGGRGA
ncbi:divalent-cation tolerance protein CutA [soil metagenome]